MRKLTIFCTLIMACALGIVPVTATGVQQDSTTGESAAPQEPDPGSFVPVPEIGAYATGFSARRRGDQFLITVSKPWQGADESAGFTYLLYPRGENPPTDVTADRLVAIPVTRVVTMSTTFLPHLAALNVLDTLVGVDALAWVFSAEVQDLGARGEIREIGSGPMVDVEQALLLEPDVIMVNSYGGDWDAQPVLENADLPVIVSGDWVETNPLGPAEWLLFTSMFYGKLDEAIAIFSEIEAEYLALRDLAAGAAVNPSVLVNAPYQGSWALSGGASYAAQFIADAGGDYVWGTDPSTGSLFYDIESVYAEAGEADIWINTGTWSSLEDAKAEDDRFTGFAAFTNGQLYNNNRRLSPGGGNDYFESGALNPQVVLKDLIWIFHGDLVPGYEPYYYQRLK